MQRVLLIAKGSTEPLEKLDVQATGLLSLRRTLTTRGDRTSLEAREMGPDDMPLVAPASPLAEVTDEQESVSINAKRRVVAAKRFAIASNLNELVEGMCDAGLQDLGPRERSLCIFG